MDWDYAKKHCNERNWEWSLELINQAQKEIEELKEKNNIEEAINNLRPRIIWKDKAKLLNINSNISV